MGDLKRKLESLRDNYQSDHYPGDLAALVAEDADEQSTPAGVDWRRGGLLALALAASVAVMTWVGARPQENADAPPREVAIDDQPAPNVAPNGSDAQRPNPAAPSNQPTSPPPKASKRQRLAPVDGYAVWAQSPAKDQAQRNWLGLRRGRPMRAVGLASPPPSQRNASAPRRTAPETPAASTTAKDEKKPSKTVAANPPPARHSPRLDRMSTAFSTSPSYSLTFRRPKHGV